MLAKPDLSSCGITVPGVPLFRPNEERVDKGTQGVGFPKEQRQPWQGPTKGCGVQIRNGSTAIFEGPVGKGCGYVDP